MAGRYREVLFTPAVLGAQQHYYGRTTTLPPQAPRDPLGPDETAFIAARDSFYLATVTETGWPYVQHRGGPKGFLRVLDSSRLAFADYAGNRQLITTGNLQGDGRVSLFLMDYPRRERLKIIGYGRVEDAREHPGLVEQLADPAERRQTERLFFIDVVSFDWNCPKYITPRFTAEEVETVVSGLKTRIRELEARLAGER
jgi:uncharacterized protein